MDKAKLASKPNVPLPAPHLGGHQWVTHIDGAVLQYFMETHGVRSMLDIGCGPGGMVELAHSLGLKSMGIDGDHTMNPSVVHDYTEGPYATNDVWDLGWSCEFLEHVEAQYLPNVMVTFSKCRFLMCTAAPPGHGGYHHVNCQPSSYWIDVMGKEGFLYSDDMTLHCRSISSMEKDFVRRTGMVFVNEVLL